MYFDVADAITVITCDGRIIVVGPLAEPLYRQRMQPALPLAIAIIKSPHVLPL